MLSNDPFGYVFQFLVLTQPLLWMNLLYRDVHLPEKVIKVFYVVGLATLCLVAYTGFEIGFYRNHLLLQYITLTLGAVYLLNQRYDATKAICLGFLLVYLNSFYWEFPMHLAELMMYGFNTGMLVQYAHLIPLLHLLPQYEYARGARRNIYAGLCISILIFILRYQLLPGYMGRYVYAVNKAVTLMILVKILCEAQPRSLKLKASQVSESII